MTHRIQQHRYLALLLLLLSCLAANGQERDRDQQFEDMLAAPNPIAAVDSPWIEALTWVEVRDRIRGGDTTAIIPTGGIEQNGPYLTTGKHNVILQVLCPEIARNLGNALCAPIVPFVPADNINHSLSGTMLFPGSISVRAETFRALLTDIGDSLKQAGFTDIVLIGDSFGNQDGMAAVAEDLNRRWDGSGARAYFVGEFYTSGWDLTMEYAEKELGVKETRSDGYHDDIWVTGIMMVTDPDTVRYEQRVAKGLASINGIDLRPLEKTVEIGRKMVDFRANYTADVIREKIGAGT